MKHSNTKKRGIFSLVDTVASNERRAIPLNTKFPLFCGLITGPLFITLMLVQGVTRVHYNPWQHPVSSLALGDFGWIQELNFLVAGFLTLAFSISLWRLLRSSPVSMWGSFLLGVWAIGLIGAGLFETDPVNGYPRGTPDKLFQPTWHGALHDLISLISFLILPLVFILMSLWFAKQRRYRWTIYSILTAIVFVGAFVLSNMAFSQVKSLVPFGGFFQRIAIVVGLSWLSMLALYFLKISPFSREKK